MNKLYLSLLSLLIILIVADSVDAHVTLDKPMGGETFVTGETVSIKWILDIQHNQNNWDLYFSSNGGSDWEGIELNIDTHQLSYAWTVPQIITDNARIRIVQDNTGGDYVDESEDFTITDVQTSIGVQEKNPAVFKLHPNYPNPFNPTTVINYELPNSTNIDLSVYNLLGQKIVTLVSGQQNAGYHSIEWNALHLSAGAYFIKLQADDFVQIKKAILIK
jgi:hypothetical protein